MKYLYDYTSCYPLNVRKSHIQNIYRHRILHEKYPDIFKDIYAANRHREYHTVRERGSKYFIFVGNIADRPHFKSIMSGGTAQITPPLVSRTTSIPPMFLVAPIKDDTGRPQDTGPGISDVNMKNLFQPLFTTKTKGIGLGLTVCKNLTEANGGRIDVESEIGKGTTFRVVLPVTGRSI